MRGGRVRFILADGESLTIADEDLRQIYELLWRLAPKPGSVSTAAVIRGAARQPDLVRTPIELRSDQSSALREAVALLRDEPEPG